MCSTVLADLACVERELRSLQAEWDAPLGRGREV